MFCLFTDFGRTGEVTFLDEDTLMLPLDSEMVIEETEAEEVVIEVLDVPIINEDPTTQPRKRNSVKWKRSIAKQGVDSGVAHTSLRGKQKGDRKIGPGCNDKCKRKCHQKFSGPQRKGIFTKFWGIQNHTKQWYFIAGLVSTVNVKRRTLLPVHENGPRRKFSYNYHFTSESGVEVQVCQKFFVETLGINQKWVRTALMKHRTHNGSIPEDRRGKIKKMTPAKAAIKRGVIEHIKSFPTIEGHYTRKDSKTKYLAENLNKRTMYSLYQLEKEAANESKYATLRMYRDIFKSEFNLKFFRPKKDQCARCLSWKNKTPQERTEAALQKHEKHLLDKEKSNELKRLDIEKVKSDEEARKSTCVLSCDFEKVLQCPKGMNRDFFFASKISVYNFTIFVSGEQIGINYVWDQTVANHGAAEVSSCLWNFIGKKVEAGITHFVIYSDNCPSQNKNQYVFSMYAMACLKYNISITHRYLEVGHTHMEVDSVHARIENSVKHTDIFVPSQWFTAIRVAKKVRPHYEVIEVNQDMVFNFAAVAQLQTWERLKTSTFREIVLDHERPGKAIYKTSFQQDEPTTADIFKKCPGRPVNWKTFKLTKKYSARIPLPDLTLTSVQKLAISGAIPSLYAPYYLEELPKLKSDIQQPAREEFSDVDSSESGSDDNDSEEDNSEEDDSDFD